MSRPITRVKIDKDSGHHGYGKAVAWSGSQEEQQKGRSGIPSERIVGPYAGSGNVLVGTENLGIVGNDGKELVGYGVHRQYDLREQHVPMSPHVQPEGGDRLEGAAVPWLKTASDTVMVNGRGAGRIGDFTVCGASITDGNDTVMVGGSDPDINISEIPKTFSTHKVEELNYTLEETALGLARYTKDDPPKFIGLDATLKKLEELNEK